MQEATVFGIISKVQSELAVLQVASNPSKPQAASEPPEGAVLGHVNRPVNQPMSLSSSVHLCKVQKKMEAEKNKEQERNAYCRGNLLLKQIL